jgi:small GTP-binding protein
MGNTHVNRIISINVLMVGDSHAGKSSLLAGIISCKNDILYVHPTETVGVDMKSVVIEGIKYNIWDTSGDPKFQFVVSRFCPRCSVVFFCYDVSNRLSFDNIRRIWVGITREYTFTCTMLIACKTDQLSVVTREEAIHFARTHGMLFSETSVLAERTHTPRVLEILSNHLHIRHVNYDSYSNHVSDISKNDKTRRCRTCF